MVHRRQIGNDTIVLGNQGDLWLNAMTWWDHQTGSIWSQPRGEAILGPLMGTQLELLSSQLTTWKEWHASWPDTLALDVVSRNLNSILDQTSIVVAVGNDSIAIPVLALKEAGVVNEIVDGVAVVFAIRPDSNSWAVFADDSLDGALNLRFEDGDLVDAASGIRYRLENGVSDDGSSVLVSIAAFTSFPGDYARLYPMGRIWSPTGSIPSAQYDEE